MAVDEFGREIPAGRGGRRSDDYGGGPQDPSYLNEALPTSRYEDGGPPAGRDGGGGGGGYYSGGSGHHAPRQQHHSHHPRGHHHHHNRDHHQSSSRHHHNNARKRKNRDDSPGPSRRSKLSQPHPSTLYAEDAMLCQFLWKESKEAEGETANDNAGESEEAAASNTDRAAYDEYRKGYCLNYIRTFFNQHMDDSWFRSLYSPLEEQRTTLQERDRAAQEATAFASELEASLSKNASEKSPCFFVLKARLGGGMKQSTLPTGPGGTSSSISPSRSMQHSSLSNPVPGTHVLAISQQVLPIQEVPPHVADEQLALALLANVKDLKVTDFKVYSSSVPGNGNLFRTSYIHCFTDDIGKEIIQQLNHADRGGAAAPPPATTDGGAGHHVPRKEETHIPKQLQLEVECSDAYGRTEVDADGKGGDGGDEAGVPPRKATVWVSTLVTPASQLTPNVAVLSAAVSSKIHIPKDMKAARKLAQAYDLRRNIPMLYRLEPLLMKAIPALADPASATEQDVEDALDLTIAYLRRVHLLSFYNGCARATRVADVLNGSHAASTIHLRLGIADEILQQTIEESKITTEGETSGEATAATEEGPPKVDLLVQRHDISIEKALSEAQAWLDDPDKWSHTVVSPDKDQQAEVIMRQERQVEPVWIEDHALIDEDGRARCSFHFCRKLFKDLTFLKKHLLKKHSEFLKAERAKCHDQSMMQAWDAQEQRPVPPILVDCGRSFSLVASPVLGAAVPLAEDPEPDLWRREEERREEEEQIRRERQERFQPPPTDLDAPLSEERPNGGGDSYTPRNNHNRGSNFVDVDDMKEEKVELAFENIEVPVQPPKKKRKKKKLL